MSAASPSPRAASWAALLGIAILCNGLAAGIWKHTHADAATFCVAFVLGKAIVNGGLWVARGRRTIADRRSRPFLVSASLAAVLNGLAWIAYLIAFERGPLAVVQTITATYTALAAALAVWLLRERLDRAQAIGVALVVIAGSLLAYAGEAKGGLGGGGGWLVAAFTTAMLWGMTAVIAKHAYGLPGADDHRFFLIHTIGLSVTLLPYGVWLAPAHSTGDHGGSATLVVALLYVAADLALYLAIARGPASIVNPLSGLYPIPTIAYAALVLGELPNRLGWIAIAVALPGILLAVPGAGSAVARYCRSGLSPRAG